MVEAGHLQAQDLAGALYSVAVVEATVFAGSTAKLGPGSRFDGKAAGSSARTHLAKSSLVETDVLVKICERYRFYPGHQLLSSGSFDPAI